MEAQELMVGNWVYNSTINQNMQVYPMMIPQLHSLEKEEGSLKDCNINPISLTEEILLKCGFRYGGVTLYFLPIPKLKCEIHATWFHNQYVIEIQNDRIPIVTEVKHLHQLQNLIHALTGEELNIEL